MNKKISLEEATMKALLGELDNSKDDVEGIVDGIMVVTDPDITPEEYEEVIERAEEIIEDTPEGEIPFNDEYIGEYLLTCPICGSSFINKEILNVGDSCPICTEVPAQGFILNGQVATQEDIELQNNIKSEEEKEDNETFEDNVEPIDEEDIEETRKEIDASEEIKTSDNKLEEAKKLSLEFSEGQRIVIDKYDDKIVQFHYETEEGKDGPFESEIYDKTKFKDDDGEEWDIEKDFGGKIKKESKVIKNEDIENKFDYTEIYNKPVFIRSKQIKNEYGIDVDTFCLSLANGDMNFEPENFSDGWDTENLEKANKAFNDNEVIILQEAISPDELETVLAVYYGIEDFEELFLNKYTDIEKIKIVKIFTNSKNSPEIIDDEEIITEEESKNCNEWIDLEEID